MENELKLSQDQELIELEKGYPEAEELLKDKSKVDELLETLEDKLRKIPKLGEQLSHLPVFIRMIKSYISKEYTQIPIASVVGIVAALICVVNPFDLIPDAIPVIGHSDDLGVLAICYMLFESDVNDFLAWRNSNK